MRLHIFVSGKVQRVGFRFFTSRTANGLGLKGFVKNLSDGRVEIVAEGNKPALERLLYLVQDGPITAGIEKVESNWEKQTEEFEGFGIKY